MLQELEKKAGKKVALHELLSCMIVNTSIVKQLLKRVIPFLEINLEVDYGANIDETRVPVAVDISRITQKLSVVESNDINEFR